MKLTVAVDALFMEFPETVKCKFTHFTVSILCDFYLWKLRGKRWQQSSKFTPTPEIPVIPYVVLRGEKTSEFLRQQY